MDVKRILGFVILLAACLVFSFLASFVFFSAYDVEDMPTFWKGLKFSGTISNVGEKQISVKDDKGIEKPFAINELTKIFLRGGTNLTEGAFVSVTYKEVRGQTPEYLARTIRVLSGPAPTASPEASASPEESTEASPSP